jgi:uncharacterized protein YjiS (DUF1127 family)
MAAIEFSEVRSERSARERSDVLGELGNRWREFLARRRDRRAQVALLRLPPHVLRDRGVDPEQIYYQLAGSWDAIDVTTLGRLLPK